MTEEEKLAWEIDKIRKEIEIDWAKLASKNLPRDKKKVIREHLEMCNSSLKILHEKLENLRGHS
jgi:predicted transcriptional regulator